MDEAQVVAPEVEPQAEQAQPDATGEKAERVYTKAEVEALVRDRLANTQRKSDEAAKRAAADAEAKVLAEQGKYKELFERQQAELDATRAQAKALELAALKRDVAAEVGLPPALAARLQGDDAEALKADAAALLAAMPKPAPPNLNSAPGASNGGGRTVPSDTEIEHMAARLGVSPKYAKQVVSEGKY